MMITIILSLLNNCGYCDNNDSDCGNDYNNKGIYLGTLFLPWHAVAVMKYVWEYIIVCFTFLLLVSFPFFIIVFTFIANCLEFAKKKWIPPSLNVLEMILQMARQSPCKSSRLSPEMNFQRSSLHQKIWRRKDDLAPQFCLWFPAFRPAWVKLIETIFTFHSMQALNKTIVVTVIYWKM